MADFQNPKKVLTILFAFILFLFGVCCSMIFYKKKISKETFADELGANLAEGKISNVDLSGRRRRPDVP